MKVIRDGAKVMLQMQEAERQMTKLKEDLIKQGWRETSPGILERDFDEAKTIPDGACS